RSHLWSIVRSLTHPSNDHSAGHQIMFSGRSTLPPGFDITRPGPGDWPSIAAVAGAMTAPCHNLPPAVVLPDPPPPPPPPPLPAQLAGAGGAHRGPWFLEASPFAAPAYGAFPEYEFAHQDRPRSPKRAGFRVPDLTLPEDLGDSRLSGRLGLLDRLDRQRADL